MRSLNSSRQLVRGICIIIILSLIAQISPRPALAARPESARFRDLAAIAHQLDRDVQKLETEGKEAFLDTLFERLAADETRACEWIAAKVKKIGARKLVLMVLGLGSPVLAGIIALLPQSWQEKLVVGALTRFVKKTIREVKERLSDLSAATLFTGLKATRALCLAPRSAASLIVSKEGPSWWERFFSNSTAVRNFVITIVALSAIGVAVGLAIAGSTAAPVVAVIGALVGLIALIVPGAHEPPHGMSHAFVGAE